MTFTDESKQGATPACNRIRRMEQLFDDVSEVVKELSEALEKYANAQVSIATLSKYYGSDQWKKDFSDDEAGLLPNSLKRGILSEDGIWNLLTDIHELNIRMKENNAKTDNSPILK